MPSPLVGRRTAGAASALTLALGTGLATPLFLADPAGAATPTATAGFSATDHAIRYTAASGQTNRVTVTASKIRGATEITYLIDDSVPISAGSGCSYPSGTDRTKVSCTVDTLESQDPYATLKVVLGDGNDVVGYDNTTDQAYYFASLDLGAGSDTLTETGRVVSNYVKGGAGDDSLTAGRVTVVSGDDGNDTIRAADGTIALGGNDNDRVYSNGSSSVDGGAGQDQIHGDAGEQSLSGGDGNDTIRGGAGRDFVYGGKGNDLLYGNNGADTIYGNSGNDRLYGGLGADTLSGGPGTDVVRQN